MSSDPDLVRLKTDISVKFSGVMPNDVQAKLFNVVGEFLEFTNVWYEDAPFTLVAGQQTYSISPAEVPAGRFARLLVIYDSADTRLPALWWTDVNAYFVLPDTIVLSEIPTQSRNWVARMSKILADVDSENDPDVPGWVIQRYRDQLMAGIYRDFYLEQHKPWSDPKLGAFWGKQFMVHKANARIDFLRDNVVGQVTWSYAQTFGPSRQRGGFFPPGM